MSFVNKLIISSVSVASVFGMKFKSIGRGDKLPILDVISRPDEPDLKQECTVLQKEVDTLLEWSGSALIVLNQNGAILQANSRANMWLSTPGMSLIGKTLLEVTFSEELFSLFRVAVEGKDIQDREVRPTLNNLVLNVSITSLSEDPIRGRRFLMVMQNITDIRRLETIRRDFVANVSHELRTPLASIRAMAETLQDGAMSDPHVANRFLGTIVHETERLKRIAEDLLILADSESRPPQRDRLALKPLIETIIGRSRPQAEKAGLSVSYEIEQDLVILANLDQMEQVLVNLIDNAIKYTSPGGSVSVIAQKISDTAVIRFRDTGIGIMSSDLNRIFERFYRVDKGRSRASGGTGLGLSIVKHIVESHEGTVSVQSEFNHGSEFTVSIPLMKENDDEFDQN